MPIFETEEEKNNYFAQYDHEKKRHLAQWVIKKYKTKKAVKEWLEKRTTDKEQFRKILNEIWV